MAASVLASVALVPATAVADEENTSRSERPRAEIDEMARETLDRLFQANPETKELFEISKGYVVLENMKVALGVSGEGGSGGAFDMEMGTGLVGFDPGDERYRVVVLFETGEAFDNFVEMGWHADVPADAAD